MTDLSSKIKLYLIIIIIFLSACNDSSGILLNVHFQIV